MRGSDIPHQSQRFVKKHPVDPESLEHGVLGPKHLDEGRPPFLGWLHDSALRSAGLENCLGPGIDPLEASVQELHPIGHEVNETKAV